MSSLLNVDRPPVFCPGCTHEQITKALDKALIKKKIPPHKTVIVSDIGCSGLFDTFFHVHALHGLHGRALTYAQGLKLADPTLNVIVTMGDGGLGIGGAHVLAACRKNLDITLIVLNNFNFGMTGGQYSATTPTDATVGSAFLNLAEVPMDVCAVAESAGATYISRCSGHDPALDDLFVDAMDHKGFALVETLGMCTGRYTKKNQLTPRAMDAMVKAMPQMNGLVAKNQRPEYGETYRRLALEHNPFPLPVTIEKQFEPPAPKREEIVILGSAGMRIVTAGDIVCYAGMAAGMNVSMKTDYNITVLRGHSVGEILISPDKIGYAGIESPTVVVAISDEGVQRRRAMFATLAPDTFLLKAKSVTIPDTPAAVVEIDFKALKVKRHDWALASLGILAKEGRVLTPDLLAFAVQKKLGVRLSLLSLFGNGVSLAQFINT